MSLIKCSTTKACSQRSPCPPVQAVWLLPRDHDVNRITWPRIKPSSVWKGVTAGDVPSSKQSKCSKHHLGFNWLQGGQQRGEYMPAFNPACEIPQSDSSPVLWLLPLSLSNSAKCKETVIKSHTWFSFFSPSLKEELLCCFGGLNSFPVSLTGANMLNMTKDYCIDWEILYIWFVTLVIIFFSIFPRFFFFFSIFPCSIHLESFSDFNLPTVSVLLTRCGSTKRYNKKDTNCYHYKL